MKKHLPYRFRLLCLVLGALFLTSCKKPQEPAGPPLLENCGILHEPEFGGVYIRQTIEEFNALGFTYGDSVDIVFSNGYTLTDIPYYNGYYTQNGEPLLVAYPGYDYIKAAINNGEDLWEEAGLKASAGQGLWLSAQLKEGMTATVRLNSAGRYQAVQKARDIHYEDERARFDSDEAFANFRSLSGGRLRENFLYRAASPCDNQHQRAPYVDALLARAEVERVLDLADTDAKLEKYVSADGFSSPYWKSLYERGGVLPIGLNMNYGSQDFKEKVAKGLAWLADGEGPCLIHCTEGKDRTGFVCMLVEALAGAGWDEIERDYMLTYNNYYRINREQDEERYDVIVENVLLPMVQSIVSDAAVNVRTADLAPYAERFLTDAGMEQETLERLLAHICKE